MKLLVTLLLLVPCTTINAWELDRVIESEGVETNVIVCDNGATKAIYLESGSYNITPRQSYDTLQEAAIVICEE